MIQWLSVFAYSACLMISGREERRHLQRRKETLSFWAKYLLSGTETTSVSLEVNRNL